MNTLKILSLLCVIALVSSCKQDNWLDWKAQNELWLANNAKQDSVETTHTGLQYKCIYKGLNDNGFARPDDAKEVIINYSGRLINGYEFDAENNAKMYVSALVEGFREGLKLMDEAGIYEFYIPYELGYGVKGTGTEGTTSHIPPYSTLIFRVTLIDVL